MVVGRTSDFPHKHTMFSLLIYPLRHIVDPLELNEAIWLEMRLALREALTHFRIAGGGRAMRFGNPRHNAGSVAHLHDNILVPDLTGRVQVTLAKEPAEVQANIERARGFAKRYEAAQG